MGEGGRKEENGEVGMERDVRKKRGKRQERGKLGQERG